MKFGLKIILMLLIALVLVLAALSGCSKKDDGTLTIFAGTVSKLPLEEVAKSFEGIKGIKVNINFGSSGKLLSEMQLTKEGDIFLPGSSDWVEVAKEKDLLDASTEKEIVYFVPSINVQKGNPKNIQDLQDLLRPGIKIGIANPETVAMGAYAVEIAEKNFSQQEKKTFRKNIATYFESAERTANALSLKAIDATIGWSVLEYWDEKRIETVKLKPKEIARFGYLPIAVSKYAKNPEAAHAFVDFVISKESLSVFEKYHYFLTVDEAIEFAGLQKKIPVGGWYSVPKEWLHK